jgi:hypothetical protein
MLAEHNTKPLINRNQARIKCGITKTEQSKPLAGIQTVIEEVSPRLEMTDYK